MGRNNAPALLFKKKLGRIVQYRYFEGSKMCNEASTVTIKPIVLAANYHFFPPRKIFRDAATGSAVILSDELQPTF